MTSKTLRILLIAGAAVSAFGITACQPSQNNTDAANAAAAASDAFFPFADGLESLTSAGVTAVVQPGGSVRDQEVIDAANAAEIVMMLTGERHFRH